MKPIGCGIHKKGDSHLIYRLDMRLIIKMTTVRLLNIKTNNRIPNRLCAQRNTTIFFKSIFKCFIFYMHTVQSCMSKFTPSKLVELAKTIIICYSLHKIIIPNRDLMWSKERVNSMIIWHIVRTTAAAIAKTMDYKQFYSLHVYKFKLAKKKKWKWKMK